MAMNRRGFFKMMAGAVAALFAGTGKAVPEVAATTLNLKPGGINYLERADFTDPARLQLTVKKIRDARDALEAADKRHIEHAYHHDRAFDDAVIEAFFDV